MPQNAIFSPFLLHSLAIHFKAKLNQKGAKNKLKMTYTSTANAFNDFLPPTFKTATQATLDTNTVSKQNLLMHRISLE